MDQPALPVRVAAPTVESVPVLAADVALALLELVVDRDVADARVHADDDEVVDHEAAHLRRPA